MRDISLHIMDIMQNSVSAKAESIILRLRADGAHDVLEVTIEDNGVGMGRELLLGVTDPFVTTRTSRKVGLGIPLLKASAERSDGSFSIDSEVNRGTVVKASFRISHIDRLPLGDIAETMTSMIISYPELMLVLELESGNGTFRFDSYEVKEKLGEVPITQYEVLAWIKEFIDEGIRSIFGGVLNEIVS